MKCMYCGAPDSKVVDSRPADGGVAIRRRRQCGSCGKRFTTYERVQAVPLLVVKRDGTREAFDIGKIRRGIVKACEKREVPLETMDEMLSGIEKRIYEQHDEEIVSEEIGEMVLDALYPVDSVAYVRFASVYRRFQSVDEFMHELHRMEIKAGQK